MIVKNYSKGKIRIGIQLTNKRYTFLHWLNHSASISRFELIPYPGELEELYIPIGPNCLVEWFDE